MSPADPKVRVRRDRRSNIALRSIGVESMGSQLVEVFRGGGGHLRAEMIKSILSGDGIEAMIVSDEIAAYPVNVGAMGEFSLLVPAEDADRSRDLLRAVGEEG